MAVSGGVRRTSALSIVALLVAVSALGGCLGGPRSPVDGPASQTSSDAPPENTTVEYVLRAGDLPESVASGTVTVRVVFVENAVDLGPCYPEALGGPYRPTVTPLPPPEGACHRSETRTLDLAALGGERSVTFEGPASAEGHALVLMDAALRGANGTSVANVRGATDRAMTDVNGDELYEGLNGTGRLDYDVRTLFESLESDSVRTNRSAYDFDRNDQSDDDVVDLFGEVA